MRNDEFNKSVPSELNSSNKSEYSDSAIKDNPITNSENGLNDNYSEDVKEFGESKALNQASNDTGLGLNDINGSEVSSSTAASQATLSLSAATTIATTALVAIVGGFTILTTTVTTKVEVKIESIVASYNYIDYKINAIGNTDSLLLTISNDFENYSFPLIEGNNIGQASNLKSNMDYNITITYDDFLVRTTAYKGVITTLSTKTYETNKDSFKLIYNCQCGVDGYFYFYMDFRDDYKYWSNFEATLEDGYGHISACVFTQDLYELQKIAIVNYDGKYNDLIGEEATLKITCDNKENNNKLVLYEEKVEI